MMDFDVEFGLPNPLSDSELTCIGCGKHPSELPEYVQLAAELAEFDSEAWSAADAVVAEEGTLNLLSGQFACTLCYVSMGMPTRGGRGWKAGDPL
jgi:hypothetical protein